MSERPGGRTEVTVQPSERTGDTVASSDRRAGDVLVRVDVVGTAVFGVTAALAATIFTTPLQWVAAIVALALFAVGVFAFLWSYWNGVQRSRQDEISTLGLYVLTGGVAPRRVRNVMMGALVVQAVIATATAFLRLDGPDGTPGSSLALGFLVPMFGFGMNGLWAAYHGQFRRRQPLGGTRPAGSTIRQDGMAD